VGGVFFIAENFIISENRTCLIEQLGDDGYHLAYGTFSTIAMGSVAYGYLKKVRYEQPLLWRLSSPAPKFAKAASFVTLSIGCFLASQVPPSFQIPVSIYESATNETPISDPEMNTATVSSANEGRFKLAIRCPFDFADNPSQLDGQVNGLERITRHPGLWSFGLVGLGCALLTPSVPQRIWLAMPAMVALVGGAHTDSRFRRGIGGELPEEYDNATSNIPFMAMLAGEQKAKDICNEMKPLNAVIAVGVSGLWVLGRGRGVKIPLRIFRATQ